MRYFSLQVLVILVYALDNKVLCKAILALLRFASLLPKFNGIGSYVIPYCHIRDRH